ncbi:terpene cyclase/mutase family protein [bacterium]|nr:terpene cyclase/mutase family protein [bacterium]
MRVTKYGKFLLWAALVSAGSGCTGGGVSPGTFETSDSGGGSSSSPGDSKDAKPTDGNPKPGDSAKPGDSSKPGDSAKPGEKPAARAIDPFLAKGLRWLVEAQHPSGGWGAGSHTAQNIRDPHAVQTDPGTTAFVGMALLRAGHTTSSGDYKETVKRAADYLVSTVEKAAEDGPRITDLTNTQPQVKLGQFVDTSLCAQFFTRLLPHLDSDPELKGRVTRALDKCVKKIQASQKDDGSWNHGGWAPVLQSSMANNALELAKDAGRPVDDKVLERSRDYQKKGFDVTTGTAARTPAAAGVELYGYASNQRANAQEARECEELVAKAKRDGRLDKDAKISEESLRTAGAPAEKAPALVMAYAQREAGQRRLDDEALLSGFGNNGGEEFLSYMLTSESLVVSGGERWTKWNDKMHERLAKIQNPDGSWSGHHCITSPVFCTAAVSLSLTADRDALLTTPKSNTTVAR